MLLRLSTLATGRTGVPAATAQAYADLLNAGITPVVREYGSLGCSGDLAPLAHCALAADGRGRGPRRRRRAAACRRCVAARRDRAGRPRREGRPRAHQRHRRDARHAGAGLRRPAPAAAHRRHHRRDERRGASSAPTRSSPPTCRRCARIPARRASAANLRALLAGSRDHGQPPRPGLHPVQDAYSLRCSPQVHGAARDTVAHAETVASRELASAIDNPVVTLRRPGRVQRQLPRRAGRRTCWTSSPSRSPTSPASPSGAPTGSWTWRATHGLPPFLADDPGVDSGHMIAQYTQAAIVSELKRLAAPGVGRLHPELGACRRTTSRWAGRPPASCAAPSTG